VFERASLTTHPWRSSSRYIRHASGWTNASADAEGHQFAKLHRVCSQNEPDGIGFHQLYTLSSG
jgi:hypothetical protein